MNKTKLINEKVGDILRSLSELTNLLAGADDDAGFVWEDDDGNEITLAMNKTKTATKTIENWQIKDRNGGSISIKLDY